MTGIPSLIGSLKKNQSVVEELVSTTQKELSAILDEIDRLLKLAAHLQEMWEEQQATEEELSRESLSLDGELSAESRERTKLETTNTEQERILAEAKTERKTLKQNVAATEKTLEGLEDQIRSLNRTLREKEKTLTRIEDKLSVVDDKHADQLQELQAKASEATTEAELLEAKYKALRYLIQENIITMPEAKVATELKGKDSTTLDHLQKTTFIGRFKVKEILNQMAERKIVKFDTGSGQVKVLKTIDL